MTCRDNYPYLNQNSECEEDCATNEYKYTLNEMKKCFNTCPDDTYHYVDAKTGLKSCISSCGDGFYVSQLSNLSYCYACHTNCQTCFGGPDGNCMICSNFYPFLNENFECKQNCNSNEYIFTLNNSKKCYFTCPVGTYHYSDNDGLRSCISSCEEGFFVLTISTSILGDNELYCSDCYSTCKTCTAGTSTDCLTCDQLGTSAYYSAGSCKSKCDPLYTDNLSDFKQCVTSCQSGYNFQDPLLGKICTNECSKNGFYVDTNTNACNACHQTCTTCKGNTYTDCETCVGTFNYKSDTGECLSSCKKNQFVYSLNGVTECYETCPENWYGLSLETQKICVTACLSNYYISGSLCLPCDPSCKTCFGGTSSSCSSCLSGLILFQQNCLEKCPPNYIESLGSCTPDCEQSGCSSCLITNLSTCNVCKEGYSLMNGICYSICPDGYAKVGSECKTCDISCKTCSGLSSSDCASCVDGNFYYQKICYETCPDGLVHNNGICSKPCDSPCLSCVGSSQKICESCLDDFPYLHNNNCYQKCPDGLYEDSNACKECHKSCKTCD